MGDEGRLPPPLTGVGAKLNGDWLKQVVDQGAKERDYMTTRMPRFGLANTSGLIAELAAADMSLVKPAPTFAADDKAMKVAKAGGKKLVGTQGFGCIKCHTFGDKKLPGIQAMSMTTMAKRLNRDWFHHYVINPQAFRPGTRMPTAWPNGQTTLPTVLDGSTDNQASAIWQSLTDGDKASPPVGLTHAAIELVAYDEAIIYRNFIQGAGPRAIGVGYPEKINLAFDANNLRLALIWQNGFIDASKHWEGRGPGFQTPLGDQIVTLPPTVSFARLESEADAWPKTSAKELGYKFQGYRLEKALRPIFLYSLGDVNVEDHIVPVNDSEVFHFQRTLTLSNAANPTGWLYQIAQGTKVEDLGKKAYRVDDKYVVRFPADADVVVVENKGKSDLRVRVKFEQGKAQIAHTLEW
jgi:hypothetical protein